jgi:hypothetical protein
VFLLSGATAAAETINIQVDGAGGTNGASIVCWEIAATTPVFARPRFGPPAPINLNDATGILPVLDGGTGSNLLTTGGTSQVLKQSTVGGNITVGQLAASNLVGYVALDAGSFSANVPSTTIVNVSSPGMYRVSFEAIVSTAATTSSTLPDLKLTWTDAGNNQPQSVIFNSAGLTTNTLQTVFSGTQVMSCSNFTNINFQTGATTPYASNAATQMQYNLRFRVEAI